MNPAGVITVSAVRPNPVYMATGPRSTSPPPIQVEDQLPLPEPVVKPKPLIQQQPQPGKQQNVIILIDRRPSQPFMTTGPMATSVAVPVMTRAPSAGTPVVVMPAAQPAATANPLTIMAPAPVQTQQVATRTWKRGQIYYSTDGPYPNDAKSGTIVYFDPTQMQ